MSTVFPFFVMVVARRMQLPAPHAEGAIRAQFQDMHYSKHVSHIHVSVLSQPSYGIRRKPNTCLKCHVISGVRAIYLYEGWSPGYRS